MFARLPTLATVASLALLAAATPAKRWGSPPPTTTTVTVTAPASSPTGGSTCSTGDIQCCNSVQSASDPATSLLLGLLGIVVQGVDVLVGLTCSPITVIGVGSGGSCSSSVVCCQDNSHGGLVSIGCVPIQL
ncbi:fungal hydrophobin-domain-containing protein [Lenzites betulinus]|nr:fungal hydrophobin-domain-containing protein [Lenzites betulinus]